MFGGIFICSASERKQRQNCCGSVCGNMFVRSASALASDVFNPYSRYISGKCDVRHYFRVVGFSALCFGLFNWMGVDARDYKAYELSTASLASVWGVQNSVGGGENGDMKSQGKNFIVSRYNIA